MLQFIENIHLVQIPFRENKSGIMNILLYPLFCVGPKPKEGKEIVYGVCQDKVLMKIYECEIH
jgi:hypothetical protein